MSRDGTPVSPLKVCSIYPHLIRLLLHDHLLTMPLKDAAISSPNAGKSITRSELLSENFLGRVFASYLFSVNDGRCLRNHDTVSFGWFISEKTVIEQWVYDGTIFAFCNIFLLNLAPQEWPDKEVG